MIGLDNPDNFETIASFNPQVISSLVNKKGLCENSSVNDGYVFGFEVVYALKHSYDQVHVFISPILYCPGRHALRLLFRLFGSCIACSMAIFLHVYAYLCGHSNADSRFE